MMKTTNIQKGYLYVSFFCTSVKKSNIEKFMRAIIFVWSYHSSHPMGQQKRLSLELSPPSSSRRNRSERLIFNDNIPGLPI
jgi:hypothetical protein